MFGTNFIFLSHYYSIHPGISISMYFALGLKIGTSNDDIYLTHRHTSNQILLPYQLDADIDQ